MQIAKNLPLPTRIWSELQSSSCSTVFSVIVLKISFFLTGQAKMANGPVVQTSDGLNNGMMMVPMMPSGTIAQPMNKMMTIRQPNSIGPGPVRGCIQIQQPIGLPRGMPINVNRMARPQVNTQFINPSQANTSGGMINPQQITMSSPVNLVSYHLIMELAPLAFT